MSDKKLKNIICNLLQKWNFRVVQLDEREGIRTPDLLVTYENQAYIIEIKSKIDDPEQIHKDNHKLLKGEIVTKDEPIIRQNKMSHIIRDAVAQLTQFHYNDNEFKLVWLFSDNKDSELTMSQLEYTLYGTRSIFDLENVFPLMPCYYFDFNEFFRWKEHLDGAIIYDDKYHLFCINNLSKNASRLQESYLVKQFQNYVCNPDILEKEGKALIADCDFDRRNEINVISYLNQKYNSNTINVITIFHRSATRLVSTESRIKNT